MDFKEMMAQKKGTFLIKELNQVVTLENCRVGKYLTIDGKTALDLSQYRGMSYNYIEVNK